MSFAWKEIQALAEPLDYPCHLAVAEGVDMPMNPGCWPLHMKPLRPPSLQVVIFPSMCTSLELSLLGGGSVPLMPGLAAVHPGEHLGAAAADGAGKCG